MVDRVEGGFAMSKFRPGKDRHQVMLLPPSLDDYVSPDDAVRFVDTMVEEFDLAKIRSAYSEAGRPAYRPEVLIKILVYGKMRGIRSSRELARATRENVRFMFLCCGEQPDFRTISLFRKRFAEELGGLLRQTIQIGLRENLIGLETVTVDGTILRAYAGGRSFRTGEQLAELLAKLDLSFAEDGKVDEEEDDQFGDGDGDGGVKEPDRKALREKVRAALSEIEDRPKDSHPLKRASLTDRDSRFMGSHGGRRPSYNAQASIDVRSDMVVGGYVTKNVSDGAELPQVLEEIEENTGSNPETLIADRGYCGFKGLKELVDRKIEGFIPLPRDRTTTLPRDQFIYNKKEDIYRCPGKRILRYKAQRKIRGKTAKVYVSEDCSGCELASRCLEREGARRHFNVTDYQTMKKEMEARVATDRGRAMARLRASTIERLFGHLKGNRKLRQFLVRGLKRVDAAWRFELAVYNMERLITLAR
jgi:transposase